MFNFWPFNISSKRREEAEKNEHTRERMRTFMGQPSPLPEDKRRASKVIPIGHPEHPANKPRGPLLRELEPQRPAAPVRSAGGLTRGAGLGGARRVDSTVPTPQDDIMSNPLHPLNPLNPAGVYSHAHYSAPAEPSRCDSIPSRSYDSSSSSSSCDNGLSSSSDGGSCSSSSDSF